jgi:RNA polymerase sigma-70 factor (ECF subfamily)
MGAEIRRDIYINMNREVLQELITKAQQGNAEALGTLWDEITPKLFGYLINTLKDKALAEDLLQATWLKAIEALPKFESRGAGFSAWLFAIAHNECRQHWRRGKFSAKFDESTPEPSTDDRPKLNNNLLVEQALSKLSEEDRDLLRLRYIADLSLKDLAKALNINIIAARVRLHRAISRARETLKS